MDERLTDEQVKETIIFLLEDKDAHFTANWVIADQICALFSAQVALGEVKKEANLTEESEIWEVCISDLEEAIQYLHECREWLEKALNNIDNLRGVE